MRGQTAPGDIVPRHPLRDYWRGNYRDVPWWATSAVTFALLYVLNHLDIVPDVIPWVGLLDATVVAACLALVREQLEACLR